MHIHVQPASIYDITCVTVEGVCVGQSAVLIGSCWYLSVCSGDGRSQLERDLDTENQLKVRVKLKFET